MMADPILYTPSKKDNHHPRGRRGSEVSLWSSRTYSAKSRTMSETNLSQDKGRGGQTRLLTASRPRRNTYVIDKVSEDIQPKEKRNGLEKDFNSSLHAGGIKALLDKANKGQDFVFPPEVKAYIVSHFRMIREENLRLNQSLERAMNELDQYKVENKEFREANETLKAVKGQLEREKAKNKAMMKRIKADNKDQNSNEDIIWIQKDQQKKLESRPTTASVTDPSWPATTNVGYPKGDPNERKMKMLNKSLKSLRVEISHLQRENYNMRQVLIREIGSEDEVERALAVPIDSAEDAKEVPWEGRAAKIANLQSQLDNLKLISNNSRNGSSGSSSPKYQLRGNGDGSSRQGSLTPGGKESLNVRQAVDHELLKELQLKYDEESTIRKVSEVERERLGEHVRVLTRRLRSAEEVVIASEVALRSERKQNAELQKLLEKAHIELRSRSSLENSRSEAIEAVEARSSSAASALVTSSAATRLSDEESLREELRTTRDNLESIYKKREEDLDMYLKMASDSRRMFTQGLKDAFDKNS